MNPAGSMRQVVTKARLLEILNEELAKYDVCDDCSFVGPVHLLQEPDETGANWSEDMHVRCSGRSADPCADAAGKAAAAVRRSYNLAE